MSMLSCMIGISGQQLPADIDTFPNHLLASNLKHLQQAPVHAVLLLPEIVPAWSPLLCSVSMVVHTYQLAPLARQTGVQSPSAAGRLEESCPSTAYTLSGSGPGLT